MLSCLALGSYANQVDDYLRQLDPAGQEKFLHKIGHEKDIDLRLQAAIAYVQRDNTDAEIAIYTDSVYDGLIDFKGLVQHLADSYPGDRQGYEDRIAAVAKSLIIQSATTTHQRRHHAQAFLEQMGIGGQPFSWNKARELVKPTTSVEDNTTYILVGAFICILGWFALMHGKK